MLLNQVIAVLKGAKTRAQGVLTEAYKLIQKEGLFAGKTRVFQKISEDYPDIPDESKGVQYRADELIAGAMIAVREYLDVQLDLDVGNTRATADIVVDEKVLLAKAPVTFLLVLEKELTDLHTFVTKLPLLDTAEDWKQDDSTGLYKSGLIRTIRTQKVQRPLVKYPHSHEHPAQTEVITEDVPVGYWHETHLSGAIARPVQKAMLARVEKLQVAVKIAREAANAITIEKQKGADVLLRYIVSA